MVLNVISGYMLTMTLTQLNPADDASRGNHSERWFKGPEFLCHEEDNWPQEPSVVYTNEDLEIKNYVGVSKCSSEKSPTQRLLQYYSCWHKLKKAVAWLLRIKNVIRKSNDSVKYRAFLSVHELEDAENAAIRLVQQELFHEEISGRLTKSPSRHDKKHPFILPSKHHITDMIMRDCHARVEHQGREHEFTETNSVIKSCIKCPKYHDLVVQQQMADLPEDRISTKQRPFTTTGVDCLGPFYTRKARSQVKRYGVIFISLTVRAVHVEIAESLSTDSFINVLRRFIARREQVKSL
nr:uncharacterized protein LOC113802027 [Penaeus vannamei]